MKHLVLILILLVMTGCSHREYTNLYPHSKRNIDIDKEQCTYKAENSVPYVAPLVRVDIYHKMSKEQRREVENARRQKRQQETIQRNQRVRQLRDLCLKAKGWRWKYVDNK